MERMDILTAASRKAKRVSASMGDADCLVKTVKNSSDKLHRFKIYISKKFTRLTNAERLGWVYVKSCNRLYLFTDADASDADELNITFYKLLPMQMYSSICISDRPLFDRLTQVGGSISRDLVWDCKAQMFYFNFDKEDFSHER